MDGARSPDVRRVLSPRARLGPPDGRIPRGIAACTVGAVEVGRSAGLASQMEEAAALSRLRSLQQRLDHKLDRCVRWPAGPVMGQMWQG